MRTSAKMAAVLVLSAAGALACEKREEPMRTGETRTTSGTIDEGAKTTADADGRMTEERAKTDAAKADADRERARADACEAKETARTDRAKAKAAKDAKEAKDAREAAAKAKEEESARPHVTVGEHVGHATITSAPMAPNDSTTLGDSSSGMYTGGDGTYGGKATWGTGKRAPAPATTTPSR